MSVASRQSLRWSSILLGCALVGWHTLASLGSQPSADKKKLIDGFYTIVATHAQKQKLKPQQDEIVVRREQKQADKSTTIEYFLLKHKPAIPLLLAEPPSVRKIDEDAVGVFLTLKKSMAARLEHYTRKNKGKQVAIVIENQIVSTHTVRETIRGGKLKITSCPRDAIHGLIKRLKQRKP